MGLRKSEDPLKDYDSEPEKNPDFPVYQMIARLTGLEPGRMYFYRVVAKTAGGIQASVVPGVEGHVGRIFDSFKSPVGEDEK